MISVIHLFHDMCNFPRLVSEILACNGGLVIFSKLPTATYSTSRRDPTLPTPFHTVGNVGLHLIIL